jgi:WD40 repeat protein
MFGHHVTQHRVDDHQLVKKYDFRRPPSSLVTTLDSKHLFVGLYDGSLHQISIVRKKVIKSHHKIHEGEIYSMAVTRDNNFLFTCSDDGCVKKYSIPYERVLQDFDGICKQWITTIQLAPGEQTLFVYGHNCTLKLIDLRDGRTVHDFGMVHTEVNHHNQGMLLTGGGEYLFTCSTFGGLKQ